MIRQFIGDCRVILPTLAPASIQTVVTSPPYYGLRDYGLSPLVWGGDAEHEHTFGTSIPGDNRGGSGTFNGRNGYGEGYGRDAVRGSFCACGAWLGSLGLEPTPELYIEHIVECFRHVKRALRDDGTLWVNIGDSYAGSGKGPSGNIQGEASCGVRIGSAHGEPGHTSGVTPPKGWKPKDLLGIPWMLAFALRADGWYLRSDIIWSKPNPMPESVTDRPTKAHEYLFLLSKSRDYFYDADAIRESAQYGRREQPADTWNRVGNGGKSPEHVTGATPGSDPSAGRNKRSVWEIATAPYAAAHFACVDDETEALTPSGWRRQDELQDGDWIVAYNRDAGGIQWERASFYRYPYDGDMIALDKRDMSQLLTPNHRCLVRRRGGVTAVVRADELRARMDVPTTAVWLSGEWRTIGAEWASLLGWYITEGENRYPGRVRIYQSQSANPQKVEIIRALLDSLGADYTARQRTRVGKYGESTEVEFSVSGHVARKLQELASAKAMTPELAQLAAADAMALLDALIDGDGHRRKDGRSCIIQKDKASIDAMQMLALRLGYRAHVSPRDDGGYALYLTRGEWLTLRGTNGAHNTIYTRQYRGIVWCPSVQSAFWLARRNGKPFITGNTFPPKLVEPCVKAGTSERGCCPECGAPWERVTDVSYVKSPVHGEGSVVGRHYDTGANGWDGTGMPRLNKEVRTTGWQPACVHGKSQTGRGWEPVPCTILDPFAGAGTVGLVADRLGRNAVLCELKSDYVDMGVERIVGDAPLFAQVEKSSVQC
jgi:DNA modification methylase